MPEYEVILAQEGCRNRRSFHARIWLLYCGPISLQISQSTGFQEIPLTRRPPRQTQNLGNPSPLSRRQKTSRWTCVRPLVWQPVFANTVWFQNTFQPRNSHGKQKSYSPVAVPLSDVAVLDLTSAKLGVHLFYFGFVWPLLQVCNARRSVPNYFR